MRFCAAVLKQHVINATKIVIILIFSGMLRGFDLILSPCLLYSLLEYFIPLIRYILCKGTNIFKDKDGFTYLFRTFAK